MRLRVLPFRGPHTRRVLAPIDGSLKPMFLTRRGRGAALGLTDTNTIGVALAVVA
jgi:hypothetical protein